MLSQSEVHDELDRGAPTAANDGEVVVVEGTCTHCNYIGGDHWFGSSTCTGSGGGCFGCEDTPAGHIGCHSFDYEGECSVSGHSPCGISLAYEEAILEALGRKDLHAVAAQMATSMGQVRMVSGVNALLIEGCKGAIVSYIPVSESALSRIRVLQLSMVLGLESEMGILD
jgi:hypothetical protein